MPPDVTQLKRFTHIDILLDRTLIHDHVFTPRSSEPQDDLMLEYLELVKESPPHSRGRVSISCLRAHLFKSLFTGLATRTDLRARLTKARSLEEMVSSKRFHEEMFVLSFCLLASFYFQCLHYSFFSLALKACRLHSNHGRFLNAFYVARNHDLRKSNMTPSLSSGPKHRSRATINSVNVFTTVLPCIFYIQEELALAIREARLANPSAFDEEKTWYRRHTNPHAPAEWGTPQENWEAEALVVAEKRSRETQPDEVGLGDSMLWAGSAEGEGEEDY